MTAKSDHFCDKHTNRHTQWHYISIISIIILVIITRRRALPWHARVQLVHPPQVVSGGAERGSEGGLDQNSSRWTFIFSTNKNGAVSGYSHMMLRLSEFRTGLTKVATYGHIPVPLVYTQVYFSTLCVYLCKYLCIHLYSFEPFCVHICVYFFTLLCIPVYIFVSTQ